MSASSASSSDGTKFHEADLALAAANSLATEQTDKRASRSGGKPSKGAQKAPEAPIEPIQAQKPLNSPVPSDEEEETVIPLPTGNKEAGDPSANTPTGANTLATERETQFLKGKSFLESIALHKHKSDVIFIARQIQTQHIFVEMTLAQTLVLSNYSISEEEMERELKKFAFLDYFCIVKAEDMIETYPIVDVNPRDWKNSIINSPDSSIITSIENIFIANMDDTHLWNLHNIVVPATKDLEDLNINIQIPSTILRADQLTSFLCLTKTPNTNESCNNWLSICDYFLNEVGVDLIVTFPTSQQKEDGYQLASQNLQAHQSKIYEAKAVLSPRGSLDPQVFNQAQQPVGALFQSATPGSTETPLNLLGQTAQGISGPNTGSIPFIQTLSFLALSNQQKQYLTNTRKSRKTSQQKSVSST